MQFSDTSDEKAGLIQDCETIVFNEYGKITGNSDLLATFTNNLNRGYDKAVSIIIENDGRWQYDDDSYSDIAIVTTNVVSGQERYTIDASHMKITQVRVKDSAGNWSVVQPIDETDPIHRAYMTESSTTTQGIPNVYDKRGDQLIFYPQPDFNSTDGLEMRVQRQPNYFSTSDTSQTPGIAVLFHRFLTLSASLDYCVHNSLAQKNDIANMLADETARVEKFYSRRDKTEQKFIRAKQNRNR